MKNLAQQLLNTSGKGFPAQTLGRSVFHVCNGEDGERVLLVVSDCRKHFPHGFEGDELRLDDGGVALACPYTADNAAALRRHFPWCVARVPGSGHSSVALGPWPNVEEQLGLVAGTGLVPVFSASSCEPLRPADAAVFSVFSAGYRDGFAVDSGCFSSADQEPVPLDRGGIVTLTPGGSGTGDGSEYADRCFVLDPNHAVKFTREAASRCAARFGGVVNAAVAMKEKRSAAALGISLEAEDVPPEAAHLYVIRELHRRGVDCSVVFPRYPDSPKAFREAFRLHASIAKAFGGHKLALSLSGIAPEEFRELHHECDGMLHLQPDTAVWEHFTAYFPA